MFMVPSKVLKQKHTHRSFEICSSSSMIHVLEQPVKWNVPFWYGRVCDHRILSVEHEEQHRCSHRNIHDTSDKDQDMTNLYQSHNITYNRHQTVAKYFFPS